MKESIAEAHRHLDALLDEVRAALRADDAVTAKASCGDLRAALEAHFEQEDRLYYGAIARLRPELEPLTRRFGAAHGRFRELLAQVESLLARRSLADAERSLGTFASDFAKHEAAEEEMLRAIDPTQAPSL
jgi:hypothetical protein